MKSPKQIRPIVLIAILLTTYTAVVAAETIISDPKGNLCQWTKTRELDGFYEHIASNVSRGIPIVMVTYCGMWIDDKPPEENLHWGARFGPQRMLKVASTERREDSKVEADIRSQFKHNDWREVCHRACSSDPMRIAVYRLKVTPNEKWASLGVTEPFEIYNILLAYSDLRKAGVDAALNLKDGKGLTISIPNGRIDLGKDANIIGYNGHNFYYDGDFNGIHRIKSNPDNIKAVFVIGCNTKQYFRDDMIGRNIYGLLFTTSFMAPEGYVLLALSDSIAQAKNGREIARQCDSSYRYFQEKYARERPGSLFVNHAHKLFSE